MSIPCEFPIAAMLDRYCFYRQKYVMMRDGMTVHVKNPYDIKQVWEHLNGVISLCVFAGPNCTSFLSMDIDLRDKSIVYKVVATMTDLGFPADKIYVSESGNKGYHVDVFFESAIYNWMAKQLYDLIIYFGELNPRKVEYRPTSTSSIKLPLGIHQKTKRRCWFVDPETLEPIEDMFYIERTEKLMIWQVEKIIKEGNKRRFNILLEEIQNQQNCVEENAEPKVNVTKPYNPGNRIVEPGTRQKMMVREALRLYREGGEYDSIRADLTAWLMAQDPEMYKDSMDECMRNIDNITAWVMQKGRRCELGNDPNHNFHKNIRIYQTDIRQIFKGSTKAARLLAFFITVFCDRYGVCGLGINKLMEKTGIKSKITVSAASRDLVEQGVFSKQKGGYKNTGSSLRPVTNKYYFAKGYERGGEFIEIEGLVDADNIYDMYVQAVAALWDDEVIPGYLTAGEIADIREKREEIRNVAKDTASDA